MRRIVLDTETTGLDPTEGHRIIEVACIELHGRRPTGRHFHRFMNPGRDVDLAATQVHGLTAEDLADKPRFADLADELLEFVQGAELLIHNAPFDMAFLDAELKIAGRPLMSSLCTVSDTLETAREMHPGKKNSLDALCERYSVDHSRRTLHGALLDAQLLADVWLAMTRGQETLDIAMAAAPAPAMALSASPLRAAIRVLRASDEEAALHRAMCERIERESKGRCLWQRLGLAA
ncbi:MAG TPA: DNA polymerase III subunit epsilon [Usitatibacter sp.]|jgi:DNA polymerase-3 subunit epsilon|nr:DNA polymerase III subunit epsilon [Usitatibacter sp.]